MVSWMMTVKAVLISSGVATMALLLKLSVPVAVDFSVSRVPTFWSSLLSWLKPPYLYVVTNGIIITIVASSKYYRRHHDRDEEDEIVVYGGGGYKIHTEDSIVNQHQASPRILEVKDLDTGAHFGFVVANPEAEELESEAVTAVVYDDEEEKITDTVATAEEDEIEEELKSVIMVENSDLVESDVISSPISDRNNLPPIEKPLVTSRFGHRKLMKASQEGGRALRVTKPKKNETLENTWKMITEGKSTPLNRQLYRRSDTFGRGDSGGVDGEVKPVYKKSDTFRDRTNYYQLAETAKVRKEPSLSQDELNRRVEAFIKKFNEEMKLQRMESLRQYKEITSRGV
ncbi:uncharacterized protein LOC9322619 isoform X2 [Arabidopsis lyrata subsp. lyrata]|uniref:uncharacterized protein LOC9322619 isoform X2 n=1 Tax=Arabidopsis lyrata subsp. lyrata TaxID=81972 RepID=UPI000A29C64C|nr:uncharacterized protein LOC9322619 isoform X2 [Arabidopsis lyrata subsp. lyrata]|eukprot:XP_020890098.1 uncharacterized protein LOC9322619 isoform X2 [Arabidopsis lyrata subsp. lyrata]